MYLYNRYIYYIDISIIKIYLLYRYIYNIYMYLYNRYIYYIDISII